jgi:hypothetical protein
VEVKIGIHSVPRELVVETDTPAEEIERLLAAALEGKDTVFALSVAKGGRVLVPAGKIAYVEFGGAEARRVGFGNIALSPVLRPFLRPFLRPWLCPAGRTGGTGLTLVSWVTTDQGMT